MTRELAAALVLTLLAVLLLLTWWGWTNRRRAARTFSPLPSLDSLAGEPVARFPLLYVATTLAGKPYDRVAITPLAYRAKAVLAIHSDGVSVEVRGEGAVGLTHDRLLECGVATWTIDRAVEPDGLLMIRFVHDGQELDCYFRSVDYPTGDLIELVAPLCRASRGDVVNQGESA